MAEVTRPGGRLRALALLLLVLAPAAHAATISGVVFEDTDGSGFQNGSEPGIDGISVSLYGNANCDDVVDAGESTALATAVTAGGGAYTFGSLATGCYNVRLTSATDRTTTDSQLDTEHTPGNWGLTTRIMPFTVRLSGNSTVYDRANLGFVDSALQVIEHTAPNLVVDHNGYASADGPDTFTIGTQVCNNTGTTLTDVVAYVGNGTTPGEFPDSVCDGTGCEITVATGGTGRTWNASTYSGTFSLITVDEVNNGDRSDATRLLGNIDPYQCVGGYWSVQYQLVDGNGNPTFGNINNPSNSDPPGVVSDDLQYEWSVWVVDGSGSNGFVLEDSTTVRAEQEASANKIAPTGNPAGYTTINGATYSGTPTPFPVYAGQIVEVTFHNANFGTIGAGFDAAADGNFDYDFWFQPIGETFIDPDKFRLLSTNATLSGTCGGSSFAFTLTDSTYATDIDRFNVDGSSCSVVGDYTYRFIIIGPPEPGEPDPTISPYQEAASGSNNEKYNGDYCGDSPGSNAAICITFGIATGVPDVIKTVDIERCETSGDNACPTPLTLTYTLTYQNPSDVEIGEPEPDAIVVYDRIPHYEDGFRYVLGSADDNCFAGSSGVANPNYTITAGCRVQYSSDPGTVTANGDGVPLVTTLPTTWTSVEPANADDVRMLRFVLLDRVAAQTNLLPGETPPASGQVTYQLSVPDDWVGVVENVADVRIDSGDLIEFDPAYTCVKVQDDCDFQTTVALISGFGGYADVLSRPVVWWETANEVGTVGFRLERLDPRFGAYLPVHEDLLAARITAPNGGQYQFIDFGVFPGQTHTYRLIEVEVSGRERTYGPYTVSFDVDGVTRDAVSKAVGRVRAGALRSQYATQDRGKSATQRERLAARLAARAAAKGGPAVAAAPPAAGSSASGKSPGGADNGKGQDSGGTGNPNAGGPVGWVAVRDSGIHYLDVAALGLDPARVSLRNGGQLVATQPAGDGSGVLFHGRGIDSPFAAANAYLLGTDKGADIKTVNGRTPKSAVAMPAFAEHRHVETDNFSALASTDDPRADYWFDSTVVAGWMSASLGFDAPGVVTGQSARLRVNLHGYANAVDGADQRARVSLNGVPLGEGEWDGPVPHQLGFDVPAGLLQPAGNTVVVEGLPIPGAAYSVFFVDSLDLDYKRSYVAHGDVLAAPAGGGAVVSVDGFTSPDILVFDVTDAAQPQRIDATLVDNGSAGYRVSFELGGAGARFVALTRAAVTTADSVQPYEALDIDAVRAAEYLVVAPAELMEAAGRLATYRSGQGLATAVVPLAAVYGAYTHGVADPEALRSFLKDAYGAGGGRYVVLVGVGSEDYRDVLGNGDNLMPPIFVPTPEGLFAADNRYVDFDEDGTADLAIGRLPALTAEELDGMLDKIAAYESGSGEWTSRTLLFADNGDRAGNFMSDSIDVARGLPAGVDVETVYLDRFGADVAGARAALRSVLEGGVSMANYIGHGGPDRFASEGLLTVDDVATLQNSPFYPVIASLTCSVGRFELTGHTALGESLVAAAGRGAVAVWAPSGQSLNDEAAILNRAYVAAAYSGGRLGDAVLAALRSYGDEGAQPHLGYVYLLLGDPALLLK